MIYATLDPQLHPVALDDAAGFTTFWQRVATAQEAAWTGFPVGGYARVDVRHAPGTLALYGPADLDRHRISALDLPAAPDGQQLAGYSLGTQAGAVTLTPAFEAAPPPPVPQEVSRGQAKQALYAAGRLDAVEAMIAAAPRQVQIYWRDFPSFHRDHPTLLAMAGALQMSPVEVDALFRAAAAVV